MLSYKVKFSAKYLYSKAIVSGVSSSESRLLTPRHVMVIAYQKASIKLELKLAQRQEFHDNFCSFLSDLSFYINMFLVWFFSMLVFLWQSFEINYIQVKRA